MMNINTPEATAGTPIHHELAQKFDALAQHAAVMRVTTAKQRKASAALKAERLKLKGVTTRRAGHAKVQGGRSQARRDGRNAQR